MATKTGVTDDATCTAAAAARAGGLVVRGLTDPGEHHTAQLLLSRVWQTDVESPPVPGDLMRALSHAGAYVAGAFAKDKLVGVTAAFLSGAGEGVDRVHLHSHITGVLPEARGRHAGFALKLHQRAWALERGIDTVTWTFDPLVRRNAFFNLTKLGARAVSYLVDFYGEMSDGVNAGQGSDRLLVRWSLRSDDAGTAAAGRMSEPDVGAVVDQEHVLLRADAAGWPRECSLDGAGAVVCATPADVERMRGTDPDCAHAWRQAVRATLGAALADGYETAGMTRSGWYLLTRGGESR